MKGYGQFCSVARALDLLGERWTLLIVRELLSGSRRFADVRRGIPRISRTMLSARFRELAEAGVIEREEGGACAPGYRLTAAGLELAAVVRELGTWGQRWLGREVHPRDLDAGVLLWDIQRRVRRDALPEEPLVMRIELSDVRGPAGRHYLLLRRSEVSLCTVNPGFPEELCLRASRRTLIGWWRGDLTLGQARAAGLVLEGRRDRVRAFPQWFERYLFAGVAPAARPRRAPRRQARLIATTTRASSSAASRAVQPAGGAPRRSSTVKVSAQM